MLPIQFLDRLTLFFHTRLAGLFPNAFDLPRVATEKLVHDPSLFLLLHFYFSGFLFFIHFFSLLVLFLKLIYSLSLSFDLFLFCPNPRPPLLFLLLKSPLFLFLPLSELFNGSSSCGFSYFPQPLLFLEPLFLWLLSLSFLFFGFFDDIFHPSQSVFVSIFIIFKTGRFD